MKSSKLPVGFEPTYTILLYRSPVDLWPSRAHVTRRFPVFRRVASTCAPRERKVETGGPGATPAEFLYRNVKGCGSLGFTHLLCADERIPSRIRVCFPRRRQLLVPKCCSR